MLYQAVDIANKSKENTLAQKQKRLPCKAINTKVYEIKGLVVWHVLLHLIPNALGKISSIRDWCLDSEGDKKGYVILN